jgi:hypothetical protein
MVEVDHYVFWFLHICAVYFMLNQSFEFLFVPTHHIWTTTNLPFSLHKPHLKGAISRSRQSRFGFFIRVVLMVQHTIAHRATTYHA